MAFIEEEEDYDAGPAEIVRLSQKDDHYLTTHLRSQVTSLVQKVKGARWWIVHHKELSTATDLLYYGLTTLLGNQTLGEEYVNVIQVNSTKTKIPSTWQRLVLVLLHAGGPYLSERLTQRIRRDLATDPQFLGGGGRRLRFLVETVILPRLTQAVSVLHRCHLLLFYFQVRYYHLAKRLTGIRYVLIRPWLEDGLSRWGYWILGLLSLVQLVLSSAIYAHSYWARTSSKFDLVPRYSSSGSSSSSSSSAVRSCPLCLEKLDSPTATPCGHVFCWQCIFQSMEIKQRCPLCSNAFDPSRLIHLRNYHGNRRSEKSD